MITPYDPPNYYLILNTAMMEQCPLLHHYPYHMVLAQQYIQGSTNYREIVKGLARREGTTLILDNGAHEGIDINLDSYREVIKDIKPNVVVLPDLVGRPAQDSFELSARFSRWAMSRSPHLKLMFAAQGQNKDEIVRAYSKAFAEWHADRCIIGFGQAYLTWEDKEKDLTQEKARFTMIQDVLQYEGLKHCQAHKYHILGARWEPHVLTWFRNKINITGLDTVKPLTSAFGNFKYPEYEKGKNKTDLLSPYLAPVHLLKDSIDELVDAYDLKPINW